VIVCDWVGPSEVMDFTYKTSVRSGVFQA